MADWKSGTLIGSGYAIVVQGRVVVTAQEKAGLRAMWQRSAEVAKQDAPFPESLVRQVCFILPPWESDAR